jgi:hypothetical protein
MLAGVNAQIVCPSCGQDYVVPFRNVLDDRRFLLCPECDAVWFAEDDTSRRSGRSLDDVFAGHQFLPGEVDWDFIEPVHDGAPSRRPSPPPLDSGWIPG